MRAWPAPSAAAAWTKSRLRRLRHSLRTMRPTGAQVTSAMTSAVLARLAPKSATTMRIRNSAGTERKTSAARMIAVSDRAAEVAGDAADRGAHDERERVATRPISSETRLPQITRLKTSRPKPSVPSQCAALGGFSRFSSDCVGVALRREHRRERAGGDHDGHDQAADEAAADGA